MTSPRRIAHGDLDAAERTALLGASVSATLAFVDARGFPRIVPCWFVWLNDRFYTTSLADKFHVQCLKRNPKAAFCVEVETVSATRRTNRQIKGVGSVAIVADEAHRIGRLVREKYLGGGAAAGISLLGDDRVSLCLTPTKVTAHGGDLILAG